MAEQKCIHCGKPVRVINYAFGPRAMHVDPNSSFPTEQKGTAWLHCRLTVAALTGDAS